MKSSLPIALLLTVTASGCLGETKIIDSGDDQPGDSKPGDTTPDNTVVDPTQPNLSGTQLRRLTRQELTMTLKDLLPSIEPNAELVRQLPEDTWKVFDNDSTGQAASALLVTGLNSIAEDEATRLVADTANRGTVVGCAPTGPADEACYLTFVKAFGRRALRRALTPDEVNLYKTTFMPIAASDADFYSAVAGTVSALLQDVEFVYRVEVGTAIAGDPSRVALNGYETATRLSFLLWGTGPDNGLLDRAEQGGLANADGRRAAATAMLADPRGQRQINRFHAMWMGYESSLPASSAIPADIRNKMRAEVDALFTKVVFEEKGSWFDVLTRKEAFVDDALAAYYGDVPAPGSATAKWTSYGASSRAGLFSTGAFLNVGNKFTDTSPTQRGKMIRERLLCTPIALPPPTVSVNVDNVPITATGCKNDGYRATVANPACTSCHSQMDKVGFGLERFDLAGRFRTFEPAGPQCPIDGAGELQMSTGISPFNGPGDLAQHLIANAQFEDCLVKQVFHFTQGRVDDTDAPTISKLGAQFRSNGDRLDTLILDMVAQPSFAQKAIQ